MLETARPPSQFRDRQVTATVGVSPLGHRATGGERLHLDVQYKTLNWKLRYRHNGADFYDLFGPVERRINSVRRMVHRHGAL